MRFQNKKISARATALALVLGVVGVLVTALPAFAATPTVTAFTPTTGVAGTPVTITGTGFTAPAVDRGHVQRGGRDVHRRRATPRSRPPCRAAATTGTATSS